MLRTKKIYIDSRFKVPGGTNTNFTFELKETLDLPDNCVAYFDDIVIPHTWFNVGNNNNKIYMRRYINTSFEDKIISLTIGQYNTEQMATELQTQIRQAFPNASGEFIVSYVNMRGYITINCNSSNVRFQILTDPDILNGLNNTWTGTPYNSQVPDSFNETLRNTEGTSNIYNINSIYISGFIDILCGKHYVYLTSSTLGCFNSLGCRGERHIVKKIAVTQNYAFNIIESAAFNGDDHLDLSRQSLRTLNFQLHDAYGQIIDLNGSHISFSIVFSILKQDN